MCPPLLLAQSGQMVRGLFEYATALINVNESAGKRGAGHGAARAEIILSEKERGALQALRRRKIGGRGLLIPLSLGGVRPPHPLFQHEATLDEPFAGLASPR